MRGNRHCLRVNDSDVSLVFNIDVQMAFTVGNRLFRRSSKIDRANYRAIRRIDNRCVGRAVTKHIDPLIERVEQNAVWPALYIDSLDRSEGLGIPHRNWFAAGEAVA